MAIDYIAWNSGTPRQSEFRTLLRQFKQARDNLATQLQMMEHMHDGANYAALESEYGAPAGKGDDVFNELASLLSKVNTDNQVTSVKAAIDQAVAKMG